MLNEGLQSMFDDYKPVNEATIHIKVGAEPTEMVEAFADVLFKEMARVAGPVGERLLEDFSVEDIRKYLLTTSWMRRARSAGLQDKATAQYRKFERGLAVPVLWYQVLIGIGKAIDRDFSIMFIPDTSIEAELLLDPGTMQAISDLMFLLQNEGLKVVAGIPIGEEGELDFMAMAHVGEVVLSYRKTHPVYGFLASFFVTEEVSKALGALVRIRYGYSSDYRVLLTRAIASVGGDR